MELIETYEFDLPVTTYVVTMVDNTKHNIDIDYWLGRDGKPVKCPILNTREVGYYKTTECNLLNPEQVMTVYEEIQTTRKILVNKFRVKYNNGFLRGYKYREQHSILEVKK